MQKKLFTQIRNEWRGNLWLALELLVVSVVMWYIIDLLYCRLATFNEPRGFDTEHCYLVEMGVLTDKSPDYKAGTNWHDDILTLVDRLRHRPEVEAVSLSNNSHPYNGSNSTDPVEYDTLRSPGWTIRRIVTPDFVRVFRYRGANGETPEQLAEMLRRGEFLASNNIYRRYGIPLTSLVGKGFHLFGDTTYNFRLGAALQDVRYSDFEQARFCYSFVFNMEQLSPGYINPDNELCIRVKEGQDHDFIARLKADSESQYRIGNIYIADVRSFADIRRSYQQAWMNQLRNYTVGMGFLLLNIFLGLLGTFWFRTQQRRSEIALHKIHGASRGAVFARLLSEGFLLLLIVTLPALVIDYNLAKLELNAWRNGTTLEWDRLLLCAGATFVLIGLMIAVGIWYPARRAMQVQPAEALHDE
ncbi:MAG TPA: ABC transporter permease [Candidatus Bacteroides merdigallinarum]|uniref:ABC transporter permease n=1 Tax=Candidatus Bacteroides merdigallinarum TaxID=2838473 RepID=A0A9D2E7F8_9BACE|nr:ABC transporter permease [Candidatus Bacteroides merdigallinarum]